MQIQKLRISIKELFRRRRCVGQSPSVELSKSLRQCKSEEVRKEDWKQVTHVNLPAPYLLSREPRKIISGADR